MHIDGNAFPPFSGINHQSRASANSIAFELLPNFTASIDGFRAASFRAGGIGQFLCQRFHFGTLLCIVRQLPQEVLVASHERPEFALTESLGSIG